MRSHQKVNFVPIFVSLLFSLSVVNSQPSEPMNGTLVCEYYNKTCDNKNNDCNKVEICDDGFCYATWKKNPSGGYITQYKGCYNNHSNECLGETECFERGESVNGEYFCCCEGNMCNQTYYPKFTAIALFFLTTLCLTQGSLAMVTLGAMIVCFLRSRDNKVSQKRSPQHEPVEGFA